MICVQQLVTGLTFFLGIDGSDQKPGDTPLSRPHRPFLGPLAAILDFESSDWSKYKECSDQKTYLAKVDGSAQ